MTTLSRRTALITASAFAAGSSTIQSPARASLNLDLTKPSDNVYAIVKMQGDVSGKTMYPWGQGHIYGVLDGEMATAMLRFQSCRIGEHRWRNDGAYVFRYRGMIFYQDYDTGEFIDSYRNPYTDQDCEVRHFRTSIGEYAYTETGTESARSFDGEVGKSYDGGYILPWQRAGDRLFVTLDERVLYRRPSDNALRLDNAILRYQANWSEVNNPELTAAETQSSWQTAISWFTWLDMGDRPGMHMQGGNGYKFSSLDDLPDAFTAFAEAKFPGVLTEPISWDD